MHVHSYQDILSKVSQHNTRHLLLGNGFSRALRNELFSYDALYTRAEASLSPAAVTAFRALATRDFESVMRVLAQSSRLAEAFQRPRMARALASAEAELREVLVTTIGSSHPNRPSDITPAQYSSCKHFLSPFSTFYTLNYDLLLYWTLMQDEIEQEIAIECDDGFRTPDSGPGTYVSWDVQNTDAQCVFYLHGALHLFDAGHELQKFVWSTTGIPLIDQIRSALATQRYPLFVSEGTAQSKLARIHHSGYLNRCYRSFAKIGGALVIFGVAMSSQDEHILELLDRTKCKMVFVGLFGDPSSPANAAIAARSERFGRSRGGRQPSIVFFDAATARPWG